MSNEDLKTTLIKMLLDIKPIEFTGVGSIVIDIKHPTDVLGKGLEIGLSINPIEPAYATRTIEAHEENE
jgi:hypothetical protein